MKHRVLLSPSAKGGGNAGRPKPARSRCAASTAATSRTTLAARPISDHDGRYIGSVALVNDETQRLKAERELDESRRRLGAIVEAHDDVFYVGEILPNGSYFEHYCGPGSERLLGGELPPEDDNMAETWDRAVHVQDRQTYADMNQQLANGEAVDVEYRLVGRDGRIRWVRDCARPRTSEDGRLVFDGVVSDITGRRERADALQAALASVQSAHEELSAAHAASEHLARTDSLTELFNRRHFRHALEAELARHDRGGEAPGIILIDIDHFKRINDSHGHECGDRVLSEIAARLASAIRPYDVLARWGGEEFVLLTPDTADADDLKQMGEKLIAAIRSTPIRHPRRLTRDHRQRRRRTQRTQSYHRRCAHRQRRSRPLRRQTPRPRSRGAGRRDPTGRDRAHRARGHPPR